MYQLISGQPSLEGKKILHIIEPALLTPELKLYINSIKCESMQVLKLGETYLQAMGFRQFSTVIVHDSPRPIEQWRKIKKFGYDSLLTEFASVKNKRYIGIDSGACMLQKHATLLDYTARNGNTDISTKMLGVLNHRIITNWDPSIPDVSYYRQVLTLSMKGDIYLFCKDSGYTSSDKSLNGTVYMARLGAMYSVQSKDGKRVLTRLALT